MYGDGEVQAVNNGSLSRRQRRKGLTVFTLAIKGHFGWFSPSLVFLRESRSKSAVSQLVAKMTMGYTRQRISPVLLLLLKTEE